MSDPLVPSRVTCIYTSRAGNRCPREPVEGETLCVLHGANVARAREQIQRKLLALQEKSVTTLEELFVMGDDKVRLAAATAVLDRTGFGPKSTVEVAPVEDVTGLDEQTLATRLERAARRLREAAMQKAFEQSAAPTGAPH